MNNKRKLIFGIGAIASIGGIIFGYHQYQNYKQKQRVLKALKEQRYQISMEAIEIINFQEKLVEQFKEKDSEGFSAEKVKNFLLGDENFKEKFQQIKVKALNYAQVTEEEYSYAINIKFKNDKDIQEIVQQLTASLDLAFNGERNYLQLKNYRKFSAKEYLKHYFKLNKSVEQNIINQNEFDQYLTSYAIEQGFHIEGYHPLYIMLLNSKAYKKLLKEAKIMFNSIFADRRKQLDQNPDHKFDDDEDLQRVYKLLDVKD